MMENNWENFLKNLGEWQGSFTKVSLTGEILDSTPSILTLESLEDNQLVRFRLRRFGNGGYDTEPTQDHSQDYRSVGSQNIFFDTGAFSKGPFQFAPFSEFGAEYGFVARDRRLRFVQLFDQTGNLNNLILIREFLMGSGAKERPFLTVDQLIGTWEGKAYQVYPDWTPSDTYTTRLEIENVGNNKLQQKLSFGNQTISSTAQITGQQLDFTDSAIARRTLLLPDGTSSNTPLQIPLRSPFFVEVGWLVSERERQRLIRSYNEKGAWIHSTLVIEHKI
ncbi:MAG: DUF3598 family protein [Microcystaceae cyanobacterium]